MLLPVLVCLHRSYGYDDFSLAANRVPCASAVPAPSARAARRCSPALPVVVRPAALISPKIRNKAPQIVAFNALALQSVGHGFAVGGWDDVLDERGECAQRVVDLLR